MLTILLADTYVLQRRFPEAVQTYERVLAAGEQTPIVRFRQASAILDWNGKFKTVARFTGAESPTWISPADRLLSA